MSGIIISDGLGGVSSTDRYASEYDAALAGVGLGEFYLTPDGSIGVVTFAIPTVAATYISANSISDPQAQTLISKSLYYLQQNSLLPDDAFFFRSGQQPSATAPKTLAGLTGVTAGTPVQSINGLALNGSSQNVYFNVTALDALTMLQDHEAVDTGQTSDGVIFCATNAAGGVTTAAQMLKYSTTFSAGGYCRQGGTTTVTSNQVDNGDNIYVSYNNGDPQVAFWSYDDAVSPTVVMGADGVINTTDSAGNTQSTSALDRIYLGSWVVTGTPGLFWKGTIGSTWLYRRVLTEAETRTVTRAAHILDPRKYSFVVQGDSNSSKRADASRTSENWPDQLVQQNAGIKSFVRLVNHAHNGTLSSTGVTEFANRVAPYSPDGAAWIGGVYAQMYGTNDLLFSADTAAVIYARRKSMMDSALALGFVGCHMTVIASLSKSAVGPFTGPQETIRVALNTAVADGYARGEFPYFCDLRLCNQLEDAVTEFFFDGFHPNVHGYKIIAEEVAAAVPIPGIKIPRSMSKPTISGTSVLTCNPGAWDGYPVLSYQWYQEATAIGGATSASYTVAGGDSGHKLMCRVTATNASGAQTRTSNLTATLP